MTMREKRTIHLAIAILRNAAKLPANTSAQTEAVQLALRVLLTCVDAYTLKGFWEVAGQEGGHSRSFRLRKYIDNIQASALRKMAGI